MPDDDDNSDEGADPSGDVKRQNPGGTTTDDLAREGDDEGRPAATSDRARTARNNGGNDADAR